MAQMGRIQTETVQLLYQKGTERSLLVWTDLDPAHSIELGGTACILHNVDKIKLHWNMKTFVINDKHLVFGVSVCACLCACVCTFSCKGGILRNARSLQ